MRAFYLLAIGAAAIASAHAGVPESRRTATWFADHPRELRLFEAACREDPGHLMNSPDCINMQQGEVLVALREARANVPPPLSAAQLDLVRRQCAHMNRATAAFYGCSSR